MAFIYAIIAGTLEIGWAMSLDLLGKTQGMNKLFPLLGYAGFGLASAFLLSKAMQTLPLATAYSIWIGVCSVGIFLVDTFYHHQTVSLIKMLSVMLIVVGVLGLKVSVGK